MAQVSEQIAAQIAASANVKNIWGGLVYNAKSYGAKGKGETDDTGPIQDAIDDCYNNGGGVVVLGPGVFKYTSFTLRQGVFLQGLNYPTDGNLRTNKADMPTVLYPTSLTLPSIIMYGGSAIKGVCWDYRDQVRNLANENDSFIQYPPTIQLGTDTESAVGCYIGDFQIFGAYDFIKQWNYTRSTEKLIIENGTGMFLNTFVHIRRSADIPRFQNIHMNLNSLANWTTGTTTNYYSKVAKNAVMFRFSRVDDCNITNCFAYGVKHFVHFSKDPDAADSGGGGGITMSGSSCDVCHQAFRIERTNFGMGIKVTNGFFTPLVGIPGSDQALVWYGNGAKFTRVTLSNIRMFGSPVSQISGSLGAAYAIVYDDTADTDNPIAIVGEIDQYSVSLIKNENISTHNTAVLIGRDKGLPVVDTPKVIADDVTTNTLDAQIVTIHNSRIYLNHPVDDKVVFRVNGGTIGFDTFWAMMHPDYGAVLSAVKYLRLGNMTALPTPDIQYRGYEIRIEGGSGVADKVCTCVKKADNTYGWYDRISGTYV